MCKELNRRCISGILVAFSSTALLIRCFNVLLFCCQIYSIPLTTVKPNNWFSIIQILHIMMSTVKHCVLDKSVLDRKPGSREYSPLAPGGIHAYDAVGTSWGLKAKLLSLWVFSRTSPICLQWPTLPHPQATYSYFSNICKGLLSLLSGDLRGYLLCTEKHRYL